MDFSVIIPAYNEEQYLPKTLQKLKRVIRKIRSHKGEIIVVDNNSTDNTARVARQAGAIVTFEPHNQISRARNRGAQCATGQYLIFVDADTTVPEALLRLTLEALDKGTVCGGGALVGSSDPVGFFGRGTMGAWNRISVHMQWAAGAFVFCLRQAWDDIGGFSLDLYASEEIAFSRQVRRWGKQREMTFHIIPEKIDTSMRKLNWFSPTQLTLMILPVTLMPFLMKFRGCCRLWYTRPEKLGRTPRQKPIAENTARQTPSPGNAVHATAPAQTNDNIRSHRQ